MSEIEWNIGDVSIDIDSNEVHFVINTKGLTKWWASDNDKYINYNIDEEEVNVDFSYPQKIKLLNILYGE